MQKKSKNKLPNVKVMKAYLGIDGRHNDALLADFLETAKELTEKVLRYEISKLDPIPSAVSESIKYVVAYLYNNRETADFLHLEKTISVVLSSLRKGVF